jgi:flagellar motor component MotA
MKKSGWIFWLLGVAVVPFGIWVGGVGMLYYIDIPSLVIVPMVGILVSIASHGVDGFFGAYRTAMAEPGSASVSDLKKGAAVLRGFAANNIVAAFFGVVLGTIAMLANVSDSRGLAAGVATVLITVFYALLVNLFAVYPFKHHLEAEASSRE